MKKQRILFMFVLTILLSACSKSPEDKANVLITESIKKSLYHPETYSPVETVVDSAFAPFDDPVFYNKALQLYKLGMAIDKYDRDAKSEKSSMAIWSGPYQSAFGRNEYKEAKEKYEQSIENKQKATAKAETLGRELKAMMDEERRFVGFKARHRYRAENNAGQTVFGEAEFLFDKDMKSIIAAYDMDEKEYKAVHILYRSMLGEDITDEDVDIE